MHIAAMKPVAISSLDVPADLIEKERAVAAGKAEEDRKDAEAEGKKPQPADIVAKRIEGGVQKYLKEVSLHNQPFVKNDKQTVEQMLKAAAPRSRASRSTSWRRHREEGRRLRGRSGCAGRGRQGCGLSHAARAAAPVTRCRFFTVTFYTRPRQLQRIHPCQKPAQPTSESC
jgi:hypothetical protein